MGIRTFTHMLQYRNRAEQMNFLSRIDIWYRFQNLSEPDCQINCF
jgi:hypothetical protein